MRSVRQTGMGMMKRMGSFASNERQTGLLMLVMALAGLLASNIPGASQIYRLVSDATTNLPLPHLDLSVSQWVQDGLLTLFFLVIGLDLRQEMASGFLKNPRNAATPIFGAIGGVIIPSLLFLAINLSSPSTSHGWTIPTATDIAFSVTVLSLASKHVQPAVRAFLLTLATVDDVIGILLIAVVYSHPSSAWALLALAICLSAWFLLIRMRRPFWPLLILVGVGAWYAMIVAGIHPTLSGVAIGLLTPALPIHQEDSPRAERYRRKLSPLSALIALPLFAFFAMGIPLSEISINTIASPVFLGVVIGLVVGKPLGIMIAVKLCGFAGLRVGNATCPMQLFGVSQLCGIGFTVSFLMSGLAFNEQSIVDTARFAVLVGSLIACLLGVLTLRIDERRRPGSSRDGRGSGSVRQVR